MHTYIYIYTYIRRDLPAYIHTYIRIYIQYIHTYSYTYINIQRDVTCLHPLEVLLHVHVEGLLAPFLLPEDLKEAISL